MDAKKTARVTFDMYMPPVQHPRDLLKLVDRADTRWIPLTAFNALWVLFEFSTPEKRDEFLSSPPAPIKMYASKFDIPEQAEIDHYEDYDGHKRAECWMCNSNPELDWKASWEIT
jgi:hypothetical protein